MQRERMHMMMNKMKLRRREKKNGEATMGRLMEPPRLQYFPQDSTPKAIRVWIVEMREGYSMCRVSRMEDVLGV